MVLKEKKNKLFINFHCKIEKYNIKIYLYKKIFDNHLFSYLLRKYIIENSFFFY